MTDSAEQILSDARAELADGMYTTHRNDRARSAVQFALDHGFEAEQERYRAVYIPQVPMHALTVETTSLEHATIALQSIIALSLFEYDNRVKPDYSDMAMIERWDGEDWEAIEDDEWEALAESMGIVIGSTES